MLKRFYRKIAFGIGPNQMVPADPLKWAQDQVMAVPEITWPGAVPTGDEQLTRYAKFVYTDRKVLREEFRTDRKGYEAAKDKLRFAQGVKFYEGLELAIRHHTALNSPAPVFERLWLFWCNHFAITDKDFMPEFTTGPFHRETIRTHMTGSFTELATAATLSWSMIHNLDNSDSVGPNSKNGQWRRKNKKPATVNENHARELLELHLLSPAAGYTQTDVIKLSYIMAGWEHKYSKKRLECNPVKFNQEKHEPGNHEVMGKRYKQRGLTPKNKLLDAIKDLSVHPACARFISLKLCRHFVCDEPTPEMMAPIITAFEETNGDLPSIHKALIAVVYAHAGTERKFQNPETWLLQMVNMSGAVWPPAADEMNYDFADYPNRRMRSPERYMTEIGHNPYRPEQPNGFPDTKSEWLSPELLIRRLTFARRFASRPYKPDNLDFDAMVEKNFDNVDEIKASVADIKTRRSEDVRMQILFPSAWMLES